MQPTSQRLIDAAGQIFSERGFRATSVQEICERAGANIAAVNYHFGSKEQLYIEAVKRAGQLATEEVPMPEWSADTPPQTKLHDFVLTFLQRAVEERGNAWSSRLILREMLEPTEACAEFVRQYVRPNFEALDQIVGQLLPFAGSQQRRLVNFSIIGQCLYYRVGRPVVRLLLGEDAFARLDMELLAQHITAFSLVAMGHARPEARLVPAEELAP